jgi:predicted DNA-binding transcriptional regulator YafY
VAGIEEASVRALSKLEQVPPTAGMLEAIDPHTCTLHTGSHSLDALVVYLALIGVDFEVSEPPELVDHIRQLADRFNRVMRQYSGTRRRTVQ